MKPQKRVPRWVELYHLRRQSPKGPPAPPPSGSVPRSSAAAIARSRSVRIATPSSAVRRCGIVISRNTCDKNRIAHHSAGHLDRWSGSPDAPPTLWAARGIEHDRFRSADGRDDRSVLIAAGNARPTVALTDALDASPHSGPKRSLPRRGHRPERRRFAGRVRAGEKIERPRLAVGSGSYADRERRVHVRGLPVAVRGQQANETDGTARRLLEIVLRWAQ